jgi:tetratricopeptide (TPR) repeat protein
MAPETTERGLRSSALRCAGLCFALLLAPLVSAGVVGAESGYDQFVQSQADVAKKATRSKDWDTAAAAWTAVLEVDPHSLAALEGLVDVATLRGDIDAEALARREFNWQLTSRVQDGENRLARTLSKSSDRLSEIDPFAGEAADLLGDFSDARAELGAAYLEAGLFANSLSAWITRFEMVPSGSEESVVALEAIRRCLAEGDDFVGRLGLAPDLSAGDRDAAWIAEFDRKTTKWSRAGEWKTPHYRIKVAGNWKLGEAIAKTMEQAHAFYREVWGIIPDPAPKRVDKSLRKINITTIAVNIFETHALYLKRTGAPEWSGGQFTGGSVDTYDHGNGSGSWRSTLKTLFHEASHQFMSEAVGAPPSFINEGVACLFESIEILPNGTIRRDLPTKRYLTELSKTLRRSRSFDLSYVMDPKNGNEPDFYAPRWGLIYFLRMYVDEQGAYVYRDQLEKYIYDFKRGSLGNMVEHFESFFVEPFELPGITNFADFTKVWRQWILDLDEAGRNNNARVAGFRKKARMGGIRKEWKTALAFHERVLDIEPDDAESVWGVARAARELGQIDRAVFMARRLTDLIDPEDDRHADASELHEQLDELSRDWSEPRRRLVGGMAGLAMRYDREEMPLMAMRVAQDVLDIDPYDASSRALVGRLEKQTGRSVIRWQRLFNGIDLTGWYGATTAAAFFVRDGQLVADYNRVAGTDDDGQGVSLYQTIFLERAVQGDWSMEVRIRTGYDWEIAGLCFGARDNEHFEGVVLRRGPDGTNRVDFGSFNGSWNFRGDGSYKADYDPTRRKGTLLRVDVRNREVSVSIDGVPLKPVVDGRTQDFIQYPMSALRGDAGLLVSKGVTRFTDLRLLAGKTH